MAVDFFGIICLQIIYLLKTNHENTTKCDNCSSHSCIIIKNSAYFVWQMSYSFDRLAHVETTWTAVLWIKPHSWTWLQTTRYHIQNLGKKGGQQKLYPQWWEPIPHHQAEKAFHFFELSTGWQITSESTVERDHCNMTCWSICLKFLLNTSNWRCWELIKSIQGGVRVRSSEPGKDLKKYK